MGALDVADGAVHWRVWALHAARVELVLLTGEQRCGYTMSREESGYFSQTLPAIPEGQRYVYCLDGGPDF